MRPIRLILAAAALLYVISQFWQEHRRFARLKKLDVRAGLTRHEQHRKRAERNLVILTGLICAVATGMAIYAFGVLPSSSGGP